MAAFEPVDTRRKSASMPEFHDFTRMFRASRSAATSGAGRWVRMKMKFPSEGRAS